MSEAAVGSHKGKKGGPTAMERIAAFIVDKRKAFFVLFIVMAVYAVFSINKVQVNNDLTDYLEEDSETRQGLTIMNDEFVTFGSGKILVANITYQRALELAEQLEEIRGISSVSFYDPDDSTYEDDRLENYYQDASALYTLSFEEEESTELSQKAIAQVREVLADYDSFVYTTVDKDDAADLQEDMKVILVIAVVIIVLVLLFTSQTYAEIPVLLLTFGMAALLNMGTNYWFREVSFITNAVGPVLQLALAIDYAIILSHRFMEEREHLPTREALIQALSKAIPEISSSSLTTVSGMVALMCMHFGIGPDLGRILTKAIIFSLLTVFLFMPALIFMFSKAMEKTVHKSFVPNITGWGKAVVKTRFILPPIFAFILVFAVYFSNHCPYIYDVESAKAEKMNEYMGSKTRISETFDVPNTLAVVLPKGDYQAEAKVIEMLRSFDQVDSVLGLAGVEVGDNNEYTLVDSLKPREFSEVADVDIDLVKALYRVYAIDQEQYGSLLSNVEDYEIPLISMVDFIYDQKENKGLRLDDDLSEQIDLIYNTLLDARKQLEGSSHSRIVFTFTGEGEGEETFQFIDTVRTLAQTFYEEEVFVVGNPTSAYDLSKSFVADNGLISVLTVLFVGIILLITFQSASIPFMLCLTIEGSIWINFSIPYLTQSPMFFLSYLVVSSIQMGATIDYAIVITSRYMELRKTAPTKKQAIIDSLNQAFPTIVTSGTIMCAAGFVIGKISSNAVISSLGTTLGIGTLTSIILVMTVLPQILLLGDKLIDKTAFEVSTPQLSTGKSIVTSLPTRVDGRVRGTFTGFIDADVTGLLSGEMNLQLQSRGKDPAEEPPQLLLEAPRAEDGEDAESEMSGEAGESEEAKESEEVETK